MGTVIEAERDRERNIGRQMRKKIETLSTNATLPGFGAELETNYKTGPQSSVEPLRNGHKAASSFGIKPSKRRKALESPQSKLFPNPLKIRLTVEMGLDGLNHEILMNVEYALRKRMTCEPSGSIHIHIVSIDKLGDYVRKNGENTRLFLAGALEESEGLRVAHKNGAWDYIKIDGRESVEHAGIPSRIIQVAEATEPLIFKRVLEDYGRNALLDCFYVSRSPKAKPSPLTEEETEVLGYIGQGMSSKEISKRKPGRLKTEQTVKNFVSQIYQKMGVKKGPAAIHKAMREGWLK